MAKNRLELFLDMVLNMDPKKADKALKDIEKKLDDIEKEAEKIELDPDVQKALKELDKLEKEFDQLNASASELDKIGSSLSDKFAKFGMMAMGINQGAEALNSIGEPYVQLDKATQSIKTLGPEAEKMAAGLRQASIEMSENLPFGAAQIQQAMGDALASGVKGGEEGLKKFADTAAKLATGGGAEIGDVVQGLGGVLNAYGKTSDEAGKYADTFFNIVNSGVTTIPELNQYLSQAIPTAASMGIQFDKVGGSLAVMTQKGIPTAQAVTKLNALFLEMAKPSKGIEEAIKASGVSFDKFQKMIKSNDLEGALKVLDKGFQATGKSATQMFSSSEAGAAFNTLTGDWSMLSQIMSDVANTSGSTENAYAKMSDSIEVRTEKMKAKFDAFMIRTADASGSFGSFAMVASQSLTKIAPTITALTGLGTLIPTKQIASLATSMIAQLVPAAVTTTTVINAQGVAVKAQSLNWKVLWASALGPVAAIVAGLAAVAAAVYLVSDALHESAEERREVLKEELKSIQLKKDDNEQSQKQLRGNLSLVETYKELSKKTKLTADEKKRLKDTTQQLNSTYPGVIQNTNSMAQNLSGLSIKAEETKSKLHAMISELDALSKQEALINQKLIYNNLDIEKRKTEDALTDMLNDIDMKDNGITIAVKLFGKATDAIAGTSGARTMAEKWIKQFTDHMYNAKTVEEVNGIFRRWKDRAFNLGLDQKQENALVAQLSKLQEAAIATKKKPEPVTPPVTPPVDNLTLDTTDATAEDKNKKSALELAREKFQLAEKELQNNFNKLENLDKEKRLKEGIAESSSTALVMEGLRLDTAEKLLEKFKEEMQLKVDDNGTIIEFGIAGLSDKDKADLQGQYTDFAKKVTDSKAVSAKLTLEIAKDERARRKLEIDVKKEIASLRLETIEFDIELGKISPDEYKEAIKEFEALGVELKKQLDSFGGVKGSMTLEQEKEYEELKKAVRDNEKFIRSLYSKQSDLKQAEIAKKYDEEAKLIEKKLTERDALVKAFDEIYFKNFSEAIDQAKDEELKAIDSSENEKIKQLEKLGELELISKEKLEERKLAIEQEGRKKREIAEEEHRKKQFALEAARKASELETQREADALRLGSTLKKLEEERKAYEEHHPEESRSEAEKDHLKGLDAQIKSTQEEFQKKGTELGVMGSQMATSVQDALAGMFAGDPEAMKEGAKGYFAMVVEILKKKLDAFILSLVLSEKTVLWIESMLGPAAFLSPAIVALAYGTISGITGAIANPILQGIASFATGSGPLRSPIIAQIGDAPNGIAERVLRDDQLMVLMNKTIAEFTNNVLPRLTDYMNKNIQANLAGEAIWDNFKLHMIQRDAISYDSFKQIVKELNVDKIWDKEIVSTITREVKVNVQTDVSEIAVKVGEEIAKRININIEQKKEVGAITNNFNSDVILIDILNTLKSLKLEAVTEGAQIKQVLKAVDNKEKATSYGI